MNSSLFVSVKRCCIITITVLPAYRSLSDPIWNTHHQGRTTAKLWFFRSREYARSVIRLLYLHTTATVHNIMAVIFIIIMHTCLIQVRSCDRVCVLLDEWPLTVLNAAGGSWTFLLYTMYNPIIIIRKPIYYNFVNIILWRTTQRGSTLAAKPGKRTHFHLWRSLQTCFPPAKSATGSRFPAHDLRRFVPRRTQRER